MNKAELWDESLSIYKKQNQVWHHGYLIGLLEGSFEVPEDYDVEWFLDFLVKYNYNPFNEDFEYLKQEYQTYLVEKFMD